MDKSIKKDKTIHIKVTQQQRDYLHRLSDKLGYKSLSKYMLDRAKSPIIFIRNDKAYRNTATQISRIGYNVNQVATKVNTFDEVQSQDIKILQSEIKKLKKQLAQIEDKVDNEENFIRLNYDKLNDLLEDD